MRRSVALLLLVLALLAGVIGLAPVSAGADTTNPTYAPLDRPGPRLRVPAATLDASLECHGKRRQGPRPILLNPGTSVKPRQNFSWNYANVFRKQGRYYCYVTMPHNTFGDIQVAGEYLVHAIRTMYRATGRRIAILGHSQGGMSPRWALRFWPDTRTKVAELIGMAPDNHGTKAIVGCIAGVTTCVPAVWQQLAGSQFMKALNSRTETFAGIDYTTVYTMLDEVVLPPTSAVLRNGRGRVANVRIQDVCPLDPHEHVLTGTVSAATYAVVIDALSHPGPAKTSRVNRNLCGRLYMPGVDPVDVMSYAPMLLALPSIVSTMVPIVTFSGAPLLRREPALRCYVYADRCR